MFACVEVQKSPEASVHGTDEHDFEAENFTQVARHVPTDTGDNDGDSGYWNEVVFANTREHDSSEI